MRESAGLVQIRLSGSDRWQPAGTLPRPLAAGDAVRTGFNARAAIELDGGGALAIGGNTQISLDQTVPGGAVVNLLFGTARISGRALGGRPLEVRAPTATARARSEAASWRAAVGGGGSAVFAVESGLVAVEDSHGASLRLRDGERVEADLAGLHEPESVPTPARARREDFAGRMRRELVLDREADSAQRLVANEVLREEYELGRVQTDASGNMVRVEEFDVRTGPASFSYVALNSRRGKGLSYYAWSGVFDRALPTNLSGVFAKLPGSADAPAPWTLTAFTATSSNGGDSLVAKGVGGHQVDVNHNADPTDDVSVLFNPATDGYAGVAGRAVYQVLFDGTGLYVNGVLKSGWTGTNLQSRNDAAPAAANDPLSGAALTAPLPAVTTNVTFPDAGSALQVVANSYSDGTSVGVENRAVAPGGGVVSMGAFGGSASGPGFSSALLRTSFEQTTTATGFGRSVEVMLSPRVLILTGAFP